MSRPERTEPTQVGPARTARPIRASPGPGHSARAGTRQRTRGRRPSSGGRGGSVWRAERVRTHPKNLRMAVGPVGAVNNCAPGGPVQLACSCSSGEGNRPEASIRRGVHVVVLGPAASTGQLRGLIGAFCVRRDALRPRRFAVSVRSHDRIALVHVPGRAFCVRRVPRAADASPFPFDRRTGPLTRRSRRSVHWRADTHRRGGRGTSRSSTVLRSSRPAARIDSSHSART